MRRQRVYTYASILAGSLFYQFKKVSYLFLEREEGRDKERERNINVWLLLTHPLLRT